MTSVRQGKKPHGGFLARLIAKGLVEPLLASALAIIAVLYAVSSSGYWQATVLDLLACVAVSLTPRWPRRAGVGLGVIVTAYLFIPLEWGTLGEYTLLVAVLGAGLRGQKQARAFMSAGYWLILSALAWKEAPTAASAALGSLVWAALFGTMWLISNVVAATIEANKIAQQAELLQQRQILARGLHDTVARSLTRVAMAAERSRLRGEVTAADLATISEAAARSTEELRWLMAVLYNTDELTLTNDPLDRALIEAQQDLERHGFAATLSVDGSLEVLRPDQSEALGSVTAEAVSNIIKHGQPDTACAIIVEIGTDLVEMVFVNQVRVAPSQPQILSLGLTSARERLLPFGGELEQESSPPQWITRVRLPLPAAASHPEKDV